MALDKQGILNELGSVMNKLQSADCGCMGKLFSNPSGGEAGATGNSPPSGGCGFGSFGGRGGCCHGHGGFNFGHGGGEPCMGNCNPRKIYADTYNYLNTNLMQPTVNEVYSDLKSITPENTVMNNSMAAKMGLSTSENMQAGNLMHGGNPMQGGNSLQGENAMYGGNAIQGGYPMENGNVHEVNYMQGGNPVQGRNAMYGRNAVQGDYSMEGRNAQGGTPMQHNQMMSRPMGNQMQANFGNDNTNQRVQQMMGGMGPNIVDMMKSGGNAKSMSSTPQSGQMAGQMPGQMPGQMLIDAPQSPHGKVGVTPLNAPGGTYNAEGGMLNNLNQQLFTPTTQYVTGADISSRGFNSNEQNYNAMAMQQGQTYPNMQQGMGNPNMRQGMGNPNIQEDIVNPNMQRAMGNPNMQQSVTNPNMQEGIANPNMNRSMANPNIQQSIANHNPGQTGHFYGGQQMASTNRNYGQHSQGMKKFNEMFPGVMGGDLDFDPMAIAVQMNPENHKRAAMDQMNKMMSGNKGSNMSKALAGGNAAAVNFSQENAAPTNQGNVPPSHQQVLYGQPESNAAQMAQNQQYGGDTNTAATPVRPNQQQVYYETNKIPQQSVFTGAPSTNQEQALAQQQYQQQQIVDNNIRAPIQPTSPTANQVATDINAPQQGQGYISESPPDPQLMIQDPIFPADTSSRPFNPPLNMRRQRFYQYNTLGQPVQMIPAKMFHSSPETNLPQTLYPQPPTGKFRKDLSGHNVKSTVSKTSLMANKPGGRTPSKSQLQNIYHQYKGSHSYTHQNVRNPAGQSDTNSEGKLGVQRVTMEHTRPMPVERVGGDTTANNQMMQNLPPVKESLIEQHGDVPATNKHHGDIIPNKEPPKMQGNVGNLRNGLQDMVYTAYPTSAAWTFHGDGGMPYSSGYRGNRGRA